MIVNHFKPRKLLLKESTEKDFIDLKIGEAEIDPTITMPPIPQSYSIRSEMTAVEDQGSQGTCTSFCVVACLEHMHQRDLSEGQVTHEAERTHGDCTEGLALIHAYQTCKAPGAVDETLWPYDDSQVCWASPPNVGGATRYRFNNIGYVYRRNRSLVHDAIKASQNVATPGLPLSLAIQRQLFARRKAVSVSVPVVWSSWPWGGDVTMPSPSLLAEFSQQAMSPPNTSGWHCIAICGWDNSTGRFIFKNSWGGFWGDGGYGTIPYQYIDLYSDVAMVGW